MGVLSFYHMGSSILVFDFAFQEHKYSEKLLNSKVLEKYENLLQRITDLKWRAFFSLKLIEKKLQHSLKILWKVVGTKRFGTIKLLVHTSLFFFENIGSDDHSIRRTFNQPIFLYFSDTTDMSFNAPSLAAESFIFV